MLFELLYYYSVFNLSPPPSPAQRSTGAADLQRSDLQRSDLQRSDLQAQPISNEVIYSEAIYSELCERSISIFHRNRLTIN